LDNPLLRAFILDLDDVEMTPMLHLVANMMTPMYFNGEEAEVVRHFMLHKVEATINNIQRRMDQLNLDMRQPEPSFDDATSADEDLEEWQTEDETTTPTGNFF